MKVKLNSETAFYAGFTILLVKYALAPTHYAFNNLTGHLLVAIGTAFLLVKIFNTKYTWNEIVLCIFGAGLALLIFISCKNDEMLTIFILTISMKRTDIDKIIKIWIYVYILVFIGTIFTSLVTQRYISTYEIFRADRGYQFRYTLGFLHPNSIHGIFMHIVAALLLQYKSWIIYVLTMVGNIILYYFTDSRAGVVATGLIILGIVFFRFTKDRFATSNLVRNIEIIALLFIVWGTVFATYSYGRYPLIVAFDQLLTGRLRLAYIFTEAIPISLFGREIPHLNYMGTVVPTGGIAFDNGIIYALLQKGIVLFLFVLGLYVFSLWKFWQEKRYVEPIILLGTTIYALCENTFFNPFRNIGVILALYFVLWGVYSHMPSGNQLNRGKESEKTYT